MPSGNVIVQVDRDDGPTLKTDRSLAYTAKKAELIQEGPGYESQIIYIRIRKAWNIGWIQIDYIKSGTQSSVIELRDSAGGLLALLSGNVQEGTFKSDNPVNLTNLPDPAFLALEITGGADTFLYYTVIFLPSMSGELEPGAQLTMTGAVRTGSWREVSPIVDPK